MLILAAYTRKACFVFLTKETASQSERDKMFRLPIPPCPLTILHQLPLATHHPQFIDT